MSESAIELVAILETLKAGRECRIGGKSVGPLSARELALLDAVLQCVRRGRNTSQSLEDLLQLPVTEQATSPGAEAGGKPPPKNTLVGPWRLGRLRAENFRGLRPAGQRFDHDFEGRTTLVFGRNGTGKSCLLGAIAWTLTGHFPFDDGELDEQHPGAVDAFRCREDGIEIEHRDPLLVLGAPPDKDYWVEVELTTDSGSLLVARNRGGTVEVRNADGEFLAGSLEEAGFSKSGLDVPLLMPRRLRTVTFKQTDRLWETLSALLGHETALKAGHLAAEVARQARQKATTEERGLNRSLDPLCQKMGDAIQGIPEELEGREELDALHVKAASDLRKEHVESAAKWVQKKYQGLRSVLASKLSQESLTEEQVRDLPGRVRGVMEQLQEGLAGVFPKTSATMEACSKIQVSVCSTQLRATVNEVNERTKALYPEWRATQDEREELLRLAAKLYDDKKATCPVCEQDVRGREIERRLLEYRKRERVTGEKVRQEARQMAMSLEQDLPTLANWQHLEPGTALSQDWEALQQRTGAALAPLLLPFKLALDELRPQLVLPLLAAELQIETERYEVAFKELLEELLTRVEGVRRGLATAKTIEASGRLLQAKLEEVASAAADGHFPENSLGRSLHDVRALVITTGQLQSASERLRGLTDEAAGLDAQRQSICGLRQLAGELDALGGVEDLVQAHTTQVLALLSKEVSQTFQTLCDQEGFSCDGLYRGDPRNPEKGDTIRAFLSYRDLAIEARHFGNEGLVRALAASTAIALLANADSSIRFTLMDDVILSLDDTYRAAFARLVAEKLGPQFQVLLATHQEQFFSKAVNAFSDTEDVSVVELLSWSDTAGVTIGPGYFLEKGKEALRKGDIRSSAVHLRSGIEGMLDALQAVLISPFLVRGDIPKSLDRLEQLCRGEVSGNLVGSFVRNLRDKVWQPVGEACHEGKARQMQPEDLECLVPALEQAVIAFKSEYARLVDLRAKSPALRQTEVKYGTRREHQQLWEELGSAVSVTAAVACRAAASDVGPGKSLVFEPVEAERVFATVKRAVLCLSDGLDPVVKRGQLVLLGERSPVAGDLVACRTQDGAHYLGRLSRAEGAVIIAPVNPVGAREARCLPESTVETNLPLIAVLYERRTANRPPHEKADWEWACMPADEMRLPEDVIAVEAVGSCMDPVVKDSQCVLARECSLSSMGNGDLCIVQRKDDRVLFKRFYQVGGDTLALTSTNPVNPEEPVVIGTRDVQRAFKVLGVLLEAHAEPNVSGQAEQACRGG